MKWTIRIRNFFLVSVFFCLGVLLVLPAGVLASTFRLSDYPGWCANAYSPDGNLTVDFKCCADGGLASYTLSYTTLHLNYPSTCTCTYAYSCGTCQVTDTKTCTVLSKSPATLPVGLTCKNQPQTTQSCTYVDNVKPTVSITAPADGDVVTGTIPFSANASDDVGIASVDFQAESVTIKTLTTPPYNIDWDSTTVGNGTRYLSAIARDKAGNSQIASINVKVNNVVTADTVKPVVNFTSPSVAGQIVDNDFTVSVNAVDAGGPIVKVEFFLDNTGSALGPAMTAAPYSYIWDTRTADNGTHTLIVKATDGAGLVGQNSVTVSVQNNNVAQTAGQITASTPCVFSCGEWNECASNNKQTCSQEVVSPAGCLMPQSHSLLAKDCLYCVYDCIEWGNCNSQGMQSCVKLSRTPDSPSCSNPEPSLTRSCAINSSQAPGFIIIRINVANTGNGNKEPGDFIFSINGAPAIKLGDIGINGLSMPQGKYTIVEKDIPSGYSVAYDNCTDVDLKAGKMVTCTITNTYGGPVVCSHDCAEWNDCGPSGYQTCARIVSKPLGANCANRGPAQLSQRCDYVAPKGSGTESSGQGVGASAIGDQAVAVDAAVVQPAGPIVCAYDYSDYGACVNGSQSRIILSKNPENCDESVAAPDSLARECEAETTLKYNRPADAPPPVSAAVMAEGKSLDEKNARERNFNGRTSGEWQKYYFGSEFCRDEIVCAGDTDPDNDGLTNNEEYRFGTDPKNPDTDGDGNVDSGEIREMRNPLISTTVGGGDKIAVQDPRESEAGNEGIYIVTDVKAVAGEIGEKIDMITGSGLPNSYVTLYVYSDPVVLNIETDADGNWYYVLDKPLELGNHEVYVAVTDNTGKVVAKSDPLFFTQTAEAATIVSPELGKAPSPAQSRTNQGYLIMALVSLAGAAIAVVAVGSIKNKMDGTR